MTCKNCNDTGSLSKDMHGYLDCTHCSIAEERLALEAWVVRNVPNCDDMITAWEIYQHGRLSFKTDK